MQEIVIWKGTDTIHLAANMNFSLGVEIIWVFLDSSQARATAAFERNLMLL